MRAFWICGLIVAALCARGLGAQTFPAKPVKIVVPYAAGGGLDFTVRALAPRLTELMGQPMLIENRPGSTGMVGAEYVVRSRNDGYTLLAGAPAEAAINRALYPKMSYDPLKDLEPIGLVAIYPNVIAVLASIPARNWSQLLTLSKQSPGGLAFGSGGTGSTQHLAGEWLKRNVGINLVHVPYKGGGPALQDLLAGQLTVVILGAAPLMPHIQARRVRALAVTTAERATGLPDVPTLAELDIRGFTPSHWFGLLAPAGAPRDAIAKLNGALTKALAAPDVAQKLASQGGRPQPTTPEAFKTFLRSEYEAYARVITEARISIQ